MKISVAMTTYNGEKYIIEQLDSLFRQTLPPDEVIICDDCSKDNTVRVTEEYIKERKYPIRLIKNKNNLGFENNFNKVLYLAGGDYIFFSDQDDIWYENKIETMIGLMEQNADCGLLCSDYEPFITGSNAPKPPRRIVKRMPNDGSLEKVKFTKQNIYLKALGCCMCLRKEFRDFIKPYWVEGWAQDDRLWKMALCTDGCYLLHLNLIKHRIHDNNTATYGNYHNLKKRVNLFRHMSEAVKQMINYADENNMPADDKKMLKNNLNMMEMRIDLLKNKKLINCIALIGYLSYYEVKKSYLTELYITLKEMHR